MIGLCNCDNTLKEAISSVYPTVILDMDDKIDLPSTLDGIFIDWSLKNTDGSKEWSKSYTRQAWIVEKYVKNIPTIIFDRYLSLSEKEYKWLRKFKVFFFEPALNFRRGFEYLPFWTRMRTLDDFDIDEKERDVCLGFKGYLKDCIVSFEKYYVSFVKNWPTYKVLYNASLRKEKVEEYKNFNIMKGSLQLKDVDCIVAIDSVKNYKIGYLNSVVFDAMSYGCIPFMPIEHRFFCSAFHHTVVDDISTMKWIINSERSIKLAVISDIYKDIKKIYPEFLIDHTIDIIKNCFTIKES